MLNNNPITFNNGAKEKYYCCKKYLNNKIIVISIIRFISKYTT